MPGEVVYVVDDDARVREALSDLLSARSMTHFVFASAAAYLRHERADAAACLILDLQLPDINGLDLQATLAASAAPPIVFISGHGDVPSTVQAMKAGAVEFLTKPVDSAVLLAAIHAAWAGDRAQREIRAERLDLAARLAALTPREREVLPLVVSGMLNKQSAALLGITETTLQIHRGQIMRKMRAASFADLVRMASRLGIPDAPAAG